MFLRWLCALNLFVTLLIIFFVILPQVKCTNKVSEYFMNVNQQEFSGHGLQVPEEVKQNLSKISFIFDGQVLVCITIYSITSVYFFT